MVFATPTDLINSYDVNVLVQLAADDDDPPTPAELLLDDYVLTSIARASADIRMACQFSNIYSDADLLSLYTSTDTSLRQQIVGLCVDRAFGYLINRRAQSAKEYESLAVRARATDDILDAMRRGYRLFTLPAQMEKGADVEVVKVATSPLNSITRSIGRFFPGDLPANKDRFGSY